MPQEVSLPPAPFPLSVPIVPMTLVAAEYDSDALTLLLTFNQPVPSFCTQSTTFTAGLSTPVGGASALSGIGSESSGFRSTLVACLILVAAALAVPVRRLARR